MTTTELREQLKLNLGITSDKQNGRLENIIDSLIIETKKSHGIVIDIENRLDHAMFILDYATYRYTAMTDDMPAHILFRLRHLYVNEGISEATNVEP